MYADGTTKDTRSQYLAIQHSLHNGNENRVNECHLPPLSKRKENANCPRNIGADDWNEF